VVVPLYCEAQRVEALLAAVHETLDGIGEPWELLLVDDGSTDDTWARITEAARTRPKLRALRLSRNFGKEAALCAGLEAATGEVAIVMDGDLQHPPTLIPAMVERWRETGCDVVEAVKTGHRRDAAAGRFFGRFFAWSMRRFSGFDLRGASDFKLITRRVLDAWLRLGERNLFFRGMIAWLGFRHEQIPFDVPRQQGRRSRWSTGRLIDLGTTGITAFSSVPLRAASLLGVVFFVFALGLGAQSLWMKLSGNAVEGFTTVIILQLLIGSLLMMLLGIIGEYIARIYEEVKGRPRYLVADEIGRGGDAAP
jgi:glycosyltransferase involved in cell wall biosynthesis